MIDTLRTLLIGLGLSESHSREHEGFYFAIEGPDEVSVQFNEAEPGALTRRTHMRRNEAALLKLCGAVSESRLTLTLFMSPRSLVLFVRADEIGPGRRSPEKPGRPAR